ncbi:mitogen-activated protein kinase kinase kinase 17-like [Coffea eugenioides]|uniref:mitogen-activated protein kinase kinase kinase 17-like n=1 Tax=Coffea eugenioides TaxID=49369 RepID=UPI000F614823|nr:mitogen-activated protein kinase kinase kinase 17-like [Coffea eugenioides]
MAHKCQCVSPQPTDWVKGEVVGSGSFGTVHLAIEKATGALFVVKSAESEIGIQSLENEADILENLDSQYIIKFLGKDFSSGANRYRKLNLFIEYMAGGSLAEVVEKFGGAVDEKLIRLYTKKILQGLKYLHDNGIVHCDLKCKNVLLGLSGNVKLADFGFAKRLNDRKKDKKSMQFYKPNIGGTPFWMAPEVLRTEGLDFAADIWSLGCTVIEMANGCRPPWGDNFSNPMSAILKIACGNGVPEFPSNLSHEGKDFLSKCLQRNPKKRWTAEELLNHPFLLGESSQRKEGTCSPASVLDLRLVHYDSDGSSDDEEFSSRVIPFSMRCQPMKSLVSEYHFVSSDEWVTVRS